MKKEFLHTQLLFLYIVIMSEGNTVFTSIIPSEEMVTSARNTVSITQINHIHFLDVL